MTDIVPHVHKAIRLSRVNGFDHVTVAKPNGELVANATFYLHTMRVKTQSHRINTAYHIALVEDWRAGCRGFDQILAGHPAAPGHVEMLRDHLRSRAPRTMELALKAAQEDPEFEPWDVVSDTEWYTRLSRSADYIRKCAELHAAAASDGKREAIRRAGERTADAVTAMMPGVEDVPRHGLTQHERTARWSVVAPGASKNPLNPLQQESLALADTMCEDLGLRANEVLLFQTEDVARLGDEPRLQLVDRRNDPNDPRASRPNLKLIPRSIPIMPDLHEKIWRYINVVRPKILAIAIDSGNDLRRRAALANRHIFVSSHGRPLSKSMLGEMNRRIRLVEGLDPTMVRAQWRNTFADDCYQAFGEGKRAGVGHIMGRRPNSKQFSRYPQGAIEREAAKTLNILHNSLLKRRTHQ